MTTASDLKLKPMATAPTEAPLLVLDEWYEMGIAVRGWELVYWLDAFDDRPAGWYCDNCGDLRHPVGWVLTTAELDSSLTVSKGVDEHAQESKLNKPS